MFRRHWKANRKHPQDLRNVHNCQLNFGKIRSGVLFVMHLAGALMETPEGPRVMPTPRQHGNPHSAGSTGAPSSTSVLQT